jgi:hypothetical protein
MRQRLRYKGACNMENETCDLVNTKPHRSAKPGEIITFGTYPKRADGTDKTPIKW